MDLKNLSDHRLHAETIRAFGRERTAIAEAVGYLAEVSRRRSYLKYGVPSLYRYGMTHLGLSEFSALQRSRAARLAAEFPETVAKLRDRKLRRWSSGRLRPSRRSCPGSRLAPRRHPAPRLIHPRRRGPWPGWRNAPYFSPWRGVRVTRSAGPSRPSGRIRARPARGP